jgi:DNA-binding CsgD family transcriptional regulator
MRGGRVAETQEAQRPTVGESGKGLAAFKPYVCLWPMIIGIVCARSGIIVGSYGSYVSTDEGVFTDGATLISFVLLAVVLVVVTLQKTPLTKRVVNMSMYACIALQAVTLVPLAIIPEHDLNMFGVLFALHVVNEFLGIFAMSYWLRCARGSSTTTVAVYVFVAFALSEIVLGICATQSVFTRDIIASALTVLQLPLMHAAHKRVRPFQIISPMQENDYLGFMKHTISNTRYLIISGIGVGIMAAIIGLLRGYPTGQAIGFTVPTRIAYMLLTITICLAIVLAVLKGRTRVVTVNIWMIMQALACIALVVYAIFPSNLEYGAVFTTTLNALMVAFDWYIIISFSSYGWRDPYYYCIGGFAMFLVPRALTRMLLGNLQLLSASTVLASALMAGLLVLSTQFIFLSLLRVQELATTESRKKNPSRTMMLQHFMGLDDEPENYTNLRQITMKQNVEEMGKQFLLSDREIEVLTLYALGYTQQRVADELYISSATVHAHIKRIYSKTGLHSRQAVLDFLQQYMS